MAFAFNQMRRISGNSILYEYNRKLISEIISESNSGRIIYSNEETQTQINLKEDNIVPEGFVKGLLKSTVEKRKEFHKLYSIVRDDKGNVITVPKEESHLYKDFREGLERSEETKKLMSKNGIKGKNSYTNGADVVYLSEEDEIPEGFYKGNCKTVGPRKDLKVFYHDPETGFSKRFESDEHAPKGWVKGRGKFNNVGSSGLSWFTNLEENKMFNKGEEPEGWVLGKFNQKLFKVFNKESIIGFYSQSEIVEVFDKSLLNTSKEKYIGHNKNYVSRLSENVKPFIGYYVEEISKDEYVSNRF